MLKIDGGAVQLHVKQVGTVSLFFFFFGNFFLAASGPRGNSWARDRTALTRAIAVITRDPQPVS